MTPEERHAEITRLFEIACNERTDLRAALLERACPDAEIRCEVLDLLAHDDAPEIDLESAAALHDDTVTAAAFDSERIDVDGFLVLRRLGSGGMGMVYEAEQLIPRRRVALKLLRPDRSTPEHRMRFDIETRALARLQHPGIAQVFATGRTVTPLGERPWVAMELIDGDPLTTYADEHDLPVERRIVLMIHICEAVHAAHQGGVIHRDLKPANILVDAAGRPKILDFGVARLIDLDCDGADFSTTDGQLLGTLPYMSPEQVSGDPTAIDIRCDVYALGVVLHQLLTGDLPYEVGGSLADTVDTIRNRPPAIASATNPRLRGDVDTILAKALEKEPDRRYPAASALAEDLGRHLRNEPITARPASAVYHLGKFARRHRALCGAVALAVVALVVGLGMALSATKRARADRERADVSAATANAALDEIRRLADSRRLDDLVRRADMLWPADESRVGDLSSWIAEAEALAARLEIHRDSMAALRLDAAPWSDTERTRDARTHRTRIEEIETDLRIAEQSVDDSDPAHPSFKYLEIQLEELEDRLDEAKEVSKERLTWSFADMEQQWRHDVVAELLGGLEDFIRPRDGKLARLRGRLAFARSVRRETVTSRREVWEQAAAEVAGSEIYGGLRLVPQSGLIPLGRDPITSLQTFLHAASHDGPIPTWDSSGRLRVDGLAGMVFVLLPGGRFTMGSRSAFAELNEQPVHEIALDPFFISKYEMSEAQWYRLCRDHSPLADDTERRAREFHLAGPFPAVRLSWDDAALVLPAHGLDLPTEAQWEYAARAGTSTPWSTGETRDTLVGHVNLADGSAREQGRRWPSIDDWPELRDGYAGRAPVAEYAPNAFGLHNVHGNVGEMCKDLAASYSVPARPGDGLRLASGTRRRTYRGGSNLDTAARARSAARGPILPHQRIQSLGARPVRPLTK